MAQYSFNKVLTGSLADAIAKVTEALKVEGFGILTDIDVQATLKAKIDKQILGYRILGACHPMMAYRAIGLEPRIGVMLPCSVLVRELEGGKVEVAIVDPMATMASVQNESLGEVASEVHGKLKKVSESLGA
ncbi:MAG: DUF302 domain-containing protein [Bdellovibrionaceae bacterium]|nr:DUF302 domain-containing protein [Pseudobdellovibrionaceae bacterium]